MTDKKTVAVALHNQLRAGNLKQKGDTSRGNKYTYTRLEETEEKTVFEVYNRETDRRYLLERVNGNDSIFKEYTWNVEEV